MSKAIKVLAGTPCGKIPVCNDFHNCFSNLVLPEGSFHYRAISGSVAVNLNLLVDMAQEQSCTHLFVVEDDSVFANDTVIRLLKHDVPVVAGLCRKRHAPFDSYIYEDINSKTGFKFYKLTPNDKGLIKGAATGMGGILINMDVFKKLKKPYFWVEWEGTKEWGQDILFGKSLIDAGIDVYCDTDVIIGHVTQCIIGSTQTPEGEWLISINIGGAIVNLPQPA